MPDATTAGERPQDVLRAWGEAFAAKDLDRMMELYEPSSVWVSDRGDMISGLAGIREVF